MGSPYASPPSRGTTHRQPLQGTESPTQDALGEEADLGHPFRLPSSPSSQLRATGHLCLALGPDRKLGPRKRKELAQDHSARGGKPRALPRFPGFPNYLSGRHDTPGRWGNRGPEKSSNVLKAADSVAQPRLEARPHLSAADCSAQSKHCILHH